MMRTALDSRAGDWEQIAVMLADPLRRAWLDHITPLRPCCQRAGIAWCREAMDLFYLLPEGDQTNILGSVS